MSEPLAYARPQPRGPMIAILSLTCVVAFFALFLGFVILFSDLLRGPIVPLFLAAAIGIPVTGLVLALVGLRHSWKGMAVVGLVLNSFDLLLLAFFFLSLA